MHPAMPREFTAATPVHHAANPDSRGRKSPDTPRPTPRHLGTVTPVASGQPWSPRTMLTSAWDGSHPPSRSRAFSVPTTVGRPSPTPTHCRVMSTTTAVSPRCSQCATAVAAPSPRQVDCVSTLHGTARVAHQSLTMTTMRVVGPRTTSALLAPAGPLCPLPQPAPLWPQPALHQVLAGAPPPDRRGPRHSQRRTPCSWSTSCQPSHLLASHHTPRHHRPR